MRIKWDKYRVELRAAGRSLWRGGVTVTGNWVPYYTTDDFNLVLTTHGEVRVRLQRGWTDIRPGQFLWLRTGRRYFAEQNPERPWGVNFLHFHLVDARGRRRPATAPLPPELINPPDAPAAEAISRRIVDLCYGFGSEGYGRPPYPAPYGEIATGLMRSLLMELDAITTLPTRTRLPPHQERCIREAAIRIAENPAASHSVADLARQAGYGRHRFTQLFRRLTGQTPELYAVHARLRRAEQLLEATALPIKDIADQLGYSDVYFFSRQFARFQGCRPTVYRQQRTATKR